MSLSAAVLGVSHFPVIDVLFECASTGRASRNDANLSPCAEPLPSQAIMLIHLTLPVRDLGAAIVFHDTLLATLDVYRVPVVADAAAYAFSADPTPFLWLIPSPVRPGSGGTRLALAVRDRDQIRRFHHTAITAGAASLQMPSAMPQRIPGAWGCSVQTPDGHQIEVLVRDGTERQDGGLARAAASDSADHGSAAP